MEPEGLLVHSPIPILSQPDTVHTPTSYFLNIYFIIILPSTSGSPEVVSFPHISPPKSCIRLSSHIYALHAPTIWFFSILSTEKYWLKGTDHSAFHCVVSYTPLSPRLSWTQIFSSAPCSRTPSACVSSSMSATKIKTRTNNRKNCSSVYINL